MKHIKKAILSIVFFLLPFILPAQFQRLRPEFLTVDSVARSVKYKKDVYRLTNDLTSAYTEQLLKARAIFIWIAENIKYDYKLYNADKKVKPIKCRPGINCQQLIIDRERKYLDKVLRKGKGICDGYSKLFKRMCDIAGIKSEVVIGYTRKRPYEVGGMGRLNHAWNAVWLDGAWHLLDVTWAAGGCEEDEDSGKLLNFKRQFNGYYWLTAPADFARNHFPRKPDWIMLHQYTKEDFAANPYYAGFIIPEIKLISPASGIIEAKKGDTIRFRMEYDRGIRHLQINSPVFRNPTVYKTKRISKRRTSREIDPLAMKKQRYVEYKRTGLLLEFDYIVPDNSVHYLELLFDYMKVMRFKVNISKEEI